MDKREFTDFDCHCMQIALEEARMAYNEGEVPVGALLAIGDKIISQDHNRVELFKSATCHAELLCLQNAAAVMGDWRLCDSTLYITLEPCSMCAGAAILSRVKRIIWGAPDLRHGAGGSWINIFERDHPIHQIEIYSGLFAEESKDLMQNFFKERRECKSMTNCLKS